MKGTITDLMSHSQFHCTGRVYLDLHGLIFETSICYWQDQPGSPRSPVGAGTPARPLPWERVCVTDPRRPPPGEGLRRQGPKLDADQMTGRDPGRVSAVGFEKPRVYRRPGPRALGGSPREDRGDPGPRDGLRGRTTGADGASRSRYRAVGAGGTRRKGPVGHPPRWALPAMEANPRVGGTARPNTGARPAGGGPPMAGHVCQSVGVLCRSSAWSRGTKNGREPQFGAGCTSAGVTDCVPRRSATSPEVARGCCLEVCVSENWVSEIVTIIPWKSGLTGEPCAAGAAGQGMVR